MAASQPRVAIVFRGIGDIGGTNNTIADHGRYLTAAGYHVDLIGQGLGKRPLAQDIGHPVSVSKLRLLRRYKWVWFDWQVDRVLRRGGYDFVAGHGHHWRQDVLSLHNCLRLAREQVYGHPPPAADGLVRLHDKLLTQRPFRLCIANSQRMKRDLVSRYGVPEEQIRVAYPGYDPERFNRERRTYHRAAVRRELGAEQAFVIGLVTSADFRKRGLDILLQAVAGLPRGHREDLVLFVLGKQGDRRPFLRVADELKLAQNIRWLAPTRTPERYFHAMDLCAHPARFEEFGQSVQEALACGVPVVTSRQVGAVELLPPAIRARLPRLPTPENIRAQIQALMDSEQARQKFSALGSRAVQANTRALAYQSTLAVYHEAGLPAAGPTQA